MFNKKGFTLVEIIVAIALLGIISVSLITIFSSQLVNINKGTEITIDAFDNQGEFEDIIYQTKEKIKTNAPLSTVPQWSEKTVEVFGEDVTLQKLAYFNLNRNNKITAVYLSDRLADVENRQLLNVENVVINVDKDPNNLVADLDQGPTLTAEFSDNSTQNEFYTNVYRWYRTEPGVDPNALSFPDDYVVIPVSQGADSISNLIDTVGANSYVVLTVTPVDVHGYRGNSVMSSNKVYIKGDEWRIGSFPWIDMNNTYSFESTPDLELKSETLQSEINVNNDLVNPNDPSDPNLWVMEEGSLFIPMGIHPSSGLEPGNVPLTITGLQEFNVLMDKNINVAKDITVSNASPVIMQAGDYSSGGNIYFHPYVKIDSEGKPVESNGVVELLDSGVSIIANSNVYLETLKGGSVYFYGKTDIHAENIQILTRGSVQINDSILHANENITINTSEDLNFSIPRVVTLVDAEFLSDTVDATIYINSPETISFKGGEWSTNQRLLIAEGRSILFDKSDDPVQNLGLLDLGNTGEVRFNNSMVEDIENQFKINLNKISNNAYQLSTENYIRNLDFADSKNNIVFSNSGQWQDLGSNQNNMEFSVSILTGPGQVDDVKFSFDGTDTLDIESNTSTQRNLTRVKIEVRDKYAHNSILSVGVFNYTIDSSGNINIDIEEGEFNFDETVSIYQIEGIEIPAINGTPTTSIIENEEYTGTLTWSPNVSKFANDTSYTATITLEPKDGYTLSGVAENFFRVDGAISVSNAANSGVVTAEFFVGGVAPGLVLHLDAASISKNGNFSTWLDESGKANNAVAIDSVDTPQKKNSGIVRFKNSALKIPVNGLDLEDDITIIAVLKPGSNGTWFRSIISQYPNPPTSSTRSWGLGWMETNRIGFYVRNDSGSGSTSKTSMTYTSNENIILSARANLSNTEIMKEDLVGGQISEVVTNHNINSSFIDSSQDLVIGYHYYDGQFGEMDIYEILIYNEYLTDQELLNIYNDIKIKYDTP